MLLGWAVAIVILGGIDVVLQRYAGLHWGSGAMVLILTNDVLVVMLVLCLDGVSDRVKDLRAERARKRRHVPRHASLGGELDG